MAENNRAAINVEENNMTGTNWAEINRNETELYSKYIFTLVFEVKYSIKVESY